MKFVTLQLYAATVKFDLDAPWAVIVSQVPAARLAEQHAPPATKNAREAAPWTSFGAASGHFNVWLHANDSAFALYTGPCDVAVRVCEAVLGRIRNEAERGSTRGATPPWIDMREEVVRLATAWDTEQELVRQAALEGDGLPPWVDGGTLRGKRR